MLKAFKYRLYPTPNQQVLLEKHFGCTRLIYNLSLETKINTYKTENKSLNYYDLANKLKTIKDDKPYLKEINSQALQQSLKHLDSAYKKFFRDKKGFPKFKNKHAKQSFTCPQHISIKQNKLIITKFKEGINMVLHRPLQGEIRSCTITKTTTSKYHVSILCETGEINLPVKPINTKTIGIDMGLNHFCILSNGLKIDNPRYLKNNLLKLKTLQQKLSTKQIGSNHRKLAKLKIARLYEKITNQRVDFQHKLSTKLVKQFDTICIESLSISKMLKNNYLAQSISDASWSSFFTMLKYKATWSGKNILELGKYEPSSKTCSICGFTHSEMSLSIREWVCPVCKTKHDRDINAAKVIEYKCLRLAEHQYQDTLTSVKSLNQVQQVRPLAVDVV